ADDHARLAGRHVISRDGATLALYLNLPFECRLLHVFHSLGTTGTVTINRRRVLGGQVRVSSCSNVRAAVWGIRLRRGGAIADMTSPPARWRIPTSRRRTS